MSKILEVFIPHCFVASVFVGAESPFAGERLQGGYFEQKSGGRRQRVQIIGMAAANFTFQHGARPHAGARDIG